MSDERIEKIIFILERVREHPTMYTGIKTSSAVGTFLHGFSTACHVFGLPLPHTMRQNATKKRGWPRSAEPWSVSDIRKRGLTDEAIADEMLAIEITAWQLLNEAARIDEAIPSNKKAR